MVGRVVSMVVQRFSPVSSFKSLPLETTSPCVDAVDELAQADSKPKLHRESSTSVQYYTPSPYRAVT